MAELSAETGWSVEKALNRLDKAFEIAKQTKQSAGMVSSVVAANRMFGLDKDAHANPDKPAELTPEQHQDALNASKRQIDIKLSTGTG
jgi:transposase